MKKTVQSRRECFIQFSEEEIEELGLKECEKLYISEKDGAVILSKGAKVEIDLSELSREALEMMIKHSCEKDISVNEVVELILRDVIERSEKGEKLQKL